MLNQNKEHARHPQSRHLLCRTRVKRAAALGLGLLVGLGAPGTMTGLLSPGTCIAPFSSTALFATDGASSTSSTTPSGPEAGSTTATSGSEAGSTTTSSTKAGSTSASSIPRKSETVYAKLDPDGRVNGIYVVNAFELNKKASFIDYGDYSKVTNISGGDSTLKGAKGEVGITAPAGRFVYQGDLAPGVKLPWTFSMRYELDGKPIKGDELSGKSGHLKIDLKIRSSKGSDDVFFDHYALQTSFSLDPEICKNIEAPDATVVNAGKSIMVNFLSLPKRDSEYSLQMDVSGFHMDPVQIAGTAIKMDFESSDLDQIDEMTGSLKDLENGIKDIADGGRKLADHSDQLTNGAADLSKAANTISQGADQLAAGLQTLSGGASRFNSGLQAFAGGVKTIDSKTGQLVAGGRDFGNGLKQLAQNGQGLVQGSAGIKGGLDQIIAGLDQASSSQQGAGDPATIISGIQKDMQDLMTKMQAASANIKALRKNGDPIENMVKGLGDMANSIDQILPLLPPAGESADACKARLLSELGIDGAALQTDPLAANIFGRLVTESQKGSNAAAALVGIKNGLNTMKDAFGSPQARAGLKALFDQIETMPEQYGPMLKGLNEKMDQLKGQLAAASKLKEALVKLQQGFSQFNSGLKAYTDAVGQLDKGYRAQSSLDDFSGKKGSPGLLSGIEQLSGGLHQIAGHTGSLINGSSQLSGGIDQAASGMDRLAGGLHSYVDGADQLSSGLNEYTGGVSKLAEGQITLEDMTRGMSDEAKEKIKKELEAFDFTLKEPVSFVSPKNTSIRTVQFVMLTDGVDKPATPRSEGTDSATPIEHKSFIDRFLDLFR